MRQVVGVFAILIIALAALPAPVGAIDFGGILARPANPVSADERTAAWFIYAMPSTEKKTDALLIKNNTNKEMTLDLYPADSTPTSGNGFALKQRAEEMTGIGKWIVLSAASLTLAPHQETTIPFTITIPNGVAPGLYAGAIMVAPQLASNKTAGMNIATRVGVRVYVTVVPRAALAAEQKNKFPYLPIVAALTIGASLSGAIVLRKKHSK